MFVRHFSSNDRTLKGQHRMVEVRFDDATYTGVDEVLTTTFHLERLDDDAVWMRVNGLNVNIYIEGRRGRKIVVVCEPDDCEPVETKGAKR